MKKEEVEAIRKRNIRSIQRITNSHDGKIFLEQLDKLFGEEDFHADPHYNAYRCGQRSVIRWLQNIDKAETKNDEFDEKLSTKI